MKVFKMNEWDWYAGEDPVSVLAYYEKDREPGLSDEDTIHEMTDEELDRFEYVLNEDDDDSITFRQRLATMIADGQEFPCFFASTEY